ncbi:sn-glycerol-3-phosphate ABC transporter ATP-binding protein UgpC [Actinocorallia sp. A-T 12471]|uniref:ABC transporter ATP-binding protein n=1 Tax=Actinocorallia sp. A-T 12471 TaxID=3089813 RepID=UPI0029D347C6|nr:sn-glycerol-3-phosphate ABC transporter ATP-binding protein UgpC [Actinocorallia sp. A-T 12471]MDX6738343.1 sn-glycerol-3-phosphate ABC transporter ATP-binding protein UgpC [Actinocorallia sp. A-T 12471]
MAEIVLDGITKRFPDGAVAVHSLDLTIADGEFVILVGPSGCGKSTTLNMIAGLEQITSGELRIDGVRMNERAPRDRDMAMVFQSYALYPHMTVAENIAFPLRLAKTDKAETARKVKEAAQTLDIEPLLSRRPANLSGGQRQRVAMGRALVRNPKAFLMDEPLSNLDAKLRIQMRTMISRLQSRLNTTTIYVTHDQTEAMTLADRIVLLNNGQVQQIGPPEALYNTPANLFTASFIGSPTMNFLTATLTTNALQTPLGPFPLTPTLHKTLNSHPTRTITIGIRPESFDPAPTTPSTTPSLTFTAHPDLIESLGPEKYAYLPLPTAPSTPLVARLPGNSPAQKGTPLQLTIPTNSLHLFNPTTGQSLT